jgi:hypothetical protein
MKETIEEAAQDYTKDGTKHYMEKTNVELGFIAGAKWQADRMISQEAYEDSLNLQRASNAGYESKIKELEDRIQTLLLQVRALS